MKKNKRLLSCKRPENSEISTQDAFKRCSSSFGFLNKKNDIPQHRSIVIPFCVVTDGRNVIGLANSTGNVDIGFAVGIAKKNRIGPFTQSGYNNLIFQAVLDGFMLMYKGSDIRKDDTFKPLSKTDFNIIQSGHVIYSIDLRQVFPVYFIHLNPDLRTRLPQTINGVSVFSLDQEILCDPAVLIRMPTVSRSVSSLIGLGYLDLPEGKKEEGF